MTKVSKILQEYKKEHRYTYAQVAQSLKLCKSTIYAYMNELRNPTMKSLIKIAAALNINVSCLIDSSELDNQELALLNNLRKEPIVYQFLLEHSEIEIQNLKKRLQKNAN